MPEQFTINIETPTLYKDVAWEMKKDLIKVGKGWPTARVEAAVTVRALPDGVDIRFISRRAKPDADLSGLKRAFVECLKENQDKYVKIMEKTFNRINK